MKKVFLVAILISLVVVAATGFALVSRQASFELPASMSVKTSTEGCYNNPGPYITLSGEMALSGINGRLVFKNNEKGTHTRTEDRIVDVVLVPEGESIKFNKQPSSGGVGGNPWIYLQFFDGNWNPISEETLLGRCVQGLNLMNFNFNMPADASVDISGSCSNSPGPYVNLDGELKLSGLNAKLIFRNNEKGTHEHEEETSVDLVIIPAGETITFAKQPPLGGVGGNPLVYFQFTDANGSPLSNQFSLGRCTQLE